MVWLSLSFLQLIICECILRGNIFLSNPRPTFVNLDSHSSHGRLLSTFHYSFSSFYHQYYHYLTSPMKVINLSLFQERSPLQITASVKVSGEIHQALWSDRLVRSVLIPNLGFLNIACRNELECGFISLQMLQTPSHVLPSVSSICSSFLQSLLVSKQSAPR